MIESLDCGVLADIRTTVVFLQSEEPAQYGAVHYCEPRIVLVEARRVAAQATQSFFWGNAFQIVGCVGEPEKVAPAIAAGKWTSYLWRGGR